MNRTQRRQALREQALMSKLSTPDIDIQFSSGQPVVIGLPLVPSFSPRTKRHKPTGLIIYPRQQTGFVTGPIRNALLNAV